MMDRNSKGLTITRVFNAPREVVWKYWTEPDNLKRWWGPRLFTCPVSRIDFKVGGKYLTSMKGPDGKEYWSTGTYKEIVPMEKIVLADSFADANGNIVSSKEYGMDGFPLELEVMIHFEQEGEKTEMTLMYPTVGDINAKTRKNMMQGWGESFDKLAEQFGR